MRRFSFLASAFFGIGLAAVLSPVSGCGTTGGNQYNHGDGGGSGGLGGAGGSGGVCLLGGCSGGSSGSGSGGTKGTGGGVKCPPGLKCNVSCTGGGA